jgi:hypothetical protein
MNGLLRSAIALAAGMTLAATAMAAPAKQAATKAVFADLLVHEWGTFTSFQDRGGRTIGGINVDDEPVPEFVHRATEIRVLSAEPPSPTAAVSKGTPSCHPDVTLRLETPVMYFYPQPGFDPNVPIDVRADFPGGWLTEFFPNAKATVPGFPKRLESSDLGSLQWRGLRLVAHPSAPLPETTEEVWLAPRKVRSTVVATDDEREKYLFYRGVGNRDAPIVVRQSGDTLTITPRDGEKTLSKLPPMWLVQVLGDGRVWYRSISGQGSKAKVSVLDRGDEAGDLNGLRKKLAAALVAHGLFADEAHAMLETWQQSYFASPGTRLFFLLPQAWTDANLPLTLSTSADKVRVMLGRIELVSATQQATLEKIYDLPDSDLSSARQTYTSLGRFRDALLVHEWHSTSDPARRSRIQAVMRSFSSCSAVFPAE